MPELASKIKMFFALAPVATVGLTKSPMTKLSVIPEVFIWVSILFITLYYSSGPETRKLPYCLPRQLPSKDLSFKRKDLERSTQVAILSIDFYSLTLQFC